MTKSTQFDGTEFLADFAQMSTFGATERGGVHREAASESDHETRKWFQGWLQNNGFKVVTDEVGNQFGMFEAVPGAPYVLTGSHLDSQPMAGRFDGAYGVLASAHAVRSVKQRIESGEITPKYNLAVVNWFNEEGSRFAPSMMGSSVYTGKMPLETALQIKDRSGITVKEALENGGELGTGETPKAALYAEIHIEQGRNLENSGAQIGLVHKTWAASKYQIKVLGDQGHTGSTLMRDRKDALYGAALLIVAVRELADAFEEGLLHTAVSELELEPNSPVTVAREVIMNLDLRTPDESVLKRANELLEEKFLEVEKKARVSLERYLTHEWGLMPYQPEGVELARKSAESLGLTHEEVMTVAGHDSTNMKDEVPTVMLFVPSIEGISHNELENTSDSDSVAGVQVLSDVIERLTVGELEG